MRGQCHTDFALLASRRAHTVPHRRFVLSLTRRSALFIALAVRYCLDGRHKQRELHVFAGRGFVRGIARRGARSACSDPQRHKLK